MPTFRIAARQVLDEPHQRSYMFWWPNGPNYGIQHHLLTPSTEVTETEEIIQATPRPLSPLAGQLMANESTSHRAFPHIFVEYQLPSRICTVTVVIDERRGSWSRFEQTLAHGIAELREARPAEAILVPVVYECTAALEAATSQLAARLR